MRREAAELRNRRVTVHRSRRGGISPGGFFISGGGWTPGGSSGRHGGSGSRWRCGRGGPGGWTRGPGGPGRLAAGLDGRGVPGGQLLLEVADMAAEGRGKQAIPGCQGAVRDPGQEAAVDLGAGGMIADGTALVHVRCSLEAVSGFQFSFFCKRIRVKDYQERGARGQHV